MLRWLAGFILGEDRFVTIDQLYEAVSSASLEITEGGPEGWPGREEFIRLMNEKVSLFYLETLLADGKHVETIDIHAFAHRGGVWVTFVNNEVHTLTHNAIKKDPGTLDHSDRQRLWQILLKVRHSLQV